MKTKTIILIIISTLIISNSMLAQKSEKNVWYGPKIGLDLSTSTRNLDQISSQLEPTIKLEAFCNLAGNYIFSPKLILPLTKCESPTAATPAPSTFSRLHS